MTPLKSIAALIAAGAIAALLFYGAVAGMYRSEVVECLKWQREAEQYREYYLLEWQQQQCAAHGIEVTAPVKGRD